jgi:uncharacterized protein
MKASSYNVILPLDAEQAYLAFNCASCGLAVLNADTAPIFQALLEGNLLDVKTPANLVEEMRRGAFLIDDEIDEVARLEAIHWASRFQTNTLSLTIAPTLACNLRCLYCYEQDVRRGGRMSAETEQQIVDFCQANDRTLRHLSVVWYGGEPLLAKGIILHLARRFREMMDRREGTYTSSMVSNGYLLDRATALELREHGVEFVQVTLDGPPAVHDSRRPRVGGRGSFETILHNLTEIVDLLRVVIRVNVDQTNQEMVPGLLDILEAEGLKHKLGIYFAQLEAYEASHKAVAKRCFSDQSFSRVETQLYQLALERGWQIGKYPQPMATYCGATRLNAFVIDPWGNLYKCWNTIGDERRRVGHVSQVVTLNAEHVRWLVTSPFKYETCRRCPILPICMGGCPYNTLVENVENVPRCERWRYNLRDILMLRYEMSRKQRQGQTAVNPVQPASLSR